MISEGENYPTGEIGDAYVDRIVVEKGGSGYTLEDKIEDFEDVFAQGIDAILTPATPSSAFAIGDEAMASDPIKM